MKQPRLNSWFWAGRTDRWEFIATWRLPWRRKIYHINSDEMYVGHSRVFLRLRWGATLDEFAPRRLVRAQVPEHFHRPHSICTDTPDGR